MEPRLISPQTNNRSDAEIEDEAREENLRAGLVEVDDGVWLLPDDPAIRDYA